MRRATLLCAALLALFAASCGSTSLGDLGSILGSPSSTQPSDVQGTVTGVDSAAQRIDLDTRYVNNLKTTQTGQSIYWDSGTRVVYQNQTYNPTDLERGDQISVRGANNNGRYIAETITVTRNVRS